MPNLLSYFHDIEKSITIKSGNKFKDKVCPVEAYRQPIHDWYRFKEGYSPNLLQELIKHFKFSEPLYLLDPFLGSGTTLLSAALDSSIQLEYGMGYEVNPFIGFMAKTKLDFYKLDIITAEKFLLLISNTGLDNNIKDDQIPELSTMKKAFSQLTLTRLINLKQIIINNFAPDEYERDFFMLVFASILEELSTMKKSGRALKISKVMIDHEVKIHFINKASKMIEDTKRIKRNPNLERVSIQNGDARNIDQNKKFNFVLFSPPYLNNFDYTEVYKVELWMLDFVTNSDKFRSLRHNTFRSHPSVKFNKTQIYLNYNSSIIKELIHSLNDTNQRYDFSSTIQAYIDDMYQTFTSLWQCTSNGAYVVCVVANSLFGSPKNNNLTPVATDLLIAEIAQDIGFTVSEIRIARKVNRRGVSFPYGRESLIILKKNERMTLETTSSVYLR